MDAANQLNSVTRAGTFTLSGATPAPATSVTVNGQAAQTNGDFTFARTNLVLLNGTNSFTNIALNAYGVYATNTFTVNLPTNVNLGFDNNGNLTNDGTRSFAFDSENQLTNVMVAGQWRSDFVYDGLNRRRIMRDYAWQGGQWVKTNEVRFTYDRRLPIQERDTNNNVLVTYTRGLDLSGSLSRAGGIGGLLARTDANGSTFYHSALGNVTALMDGNENIVARYLQDPFGRPIGQWGSMADANVMQSSSKPKYHGLYDFGFRWEWLDGDRWLNQDLIQERGGINLYRAMNNNPLRYVDPLGLEGNPVSGLGGAWNSNPYGPGGSFYGPGYQYTPSSGTSQQPELIGSQGLTDEYLQDQYQITYDRLQNKSPWQALNPFDEATFDTDFWTGKDKDFNWLTGNPKSPCDKSKTFRGNEVNYLGIGMYEAWAGDQLWMAEGLTYGWKAVANQTTPNANELYWLRNGYNAYYNIQNSSNGSK